MGSKSSTHSLLFRLLDCGQTYSRFCSLCRSPEDDLLQVVSISLIGPRTLGAIKPFHEADFASSLSLS
jgi:hypothetical protein